MNPVKLTARQQQILSLIESAVQNTGAPPTRAEIAAELGFKSANAAEEHLQALARKGVIQLVSGTSRGIRLKSAGVATPGSASPTLRFDQTQRDRSAASLRAPGRAGGFLSAVTGRACTT